MKRREFIRLMSMLGAYWAISGPINPVSVQAVQKNLSLTAPKYKVADSHFHFVDFLQHTDGLEALLNAMEANGVEHIMFSGMPLVKKWNKDDPIAPGYYLDNTSRAYWYSATDFIVAEKMKDLSPELRSRFHPFICGINATDKFSVEHIHRMLEEYPGFWQGIGEIFGHRDDLTNLTYGETARANHPALDPIYELAARKNMPVCLHNNATSRHRLQEPIYVYEVEEALGKHPKTKIIWAHAGLSRYLELDTTQYTQRLNKMLEEHSNLYIDFSWLVFEDFMLDSKTGKVKTQWLELVNNFPDRFLIGSDCIGHMNTYAKNIRKYYVLLDSLSADKAQRLAMDNFLQLLPNQA